MTDLRFGRYEALFRIGLGGMAEVYAARMRGEGGFQKLVAVKRMLPHLTGDQKFVDMFLDEARLAANIVSPHVAQTFDLGRSADDSLYIVMELIVGVNLTHFLVFLHEQQRFVDVPVGVEIIAQAAQGLDDAHEARTPTGESLSLVHRDISPQNIMVGIDGRVRVTDFGIAQALHLRTTQTQAGEKKGKYSYFAPEQAFGKPVDRRTDIFALAVVAWELLLGRRLFPGTPLEALESVRDKEIEPAHTLRPEIPESVSKVISRALDRDPDKRFSTAAEFAEALRVALREHYPPPASRDLGNFVAEAGGEWLEQLRGAIATADSPLAEPAPAIDAGPNTSAVWLALSPEADAAETRASAAALKARVDTKNDHGKPERRSRSREVAEALARTVASSAGAGSSEETNESSLTPQMNLHDLDTHSMSLPDLAEESSEQGTRTMVAAAKDDLVRASSRSSAPPTKEALAAQHTRKLNAVDGDALDAARGSFTGRARAAAGSIAARALDLRSRAEGQLVARDWAVGPLEARRLLATFAAAFALFFVFTVALTGGGEDEAPATRHRAMPDAARADDGAAAAGPGTISPDSPSVQAADVPGAAAADEATDEPAANEPAADTRAERTAATRTTSASNKRTTATSKSARAARRTARKKRTKTTDGKLPGLERWE